VGDTSWTSPESRDHVFTIWVDDTQPPAPTLTAPADGALLSDADVTLRGVASTGVGDDLSEVHVEISAGTTPGSPARTVTADPHDATGVFEATAAGLPDGTWTAQAVQADDAENVGRSAPVTFTVDTVPPAAPVLAGVTPSSPSPEEQVTVTGTAEAGSTVRLYQSADCTGPATTVTAGELAAGVAQTVPEDTTTAFSVDATDLAGNTSVCSDVLEYVEDSTAPETRIDAGPAEGARIAQARPGFAFSSSEPDSTFTCRIDDEAAQPCDDGTFTPAHDLAEGRHTLRVAATDRAGNTDPTPATRSFTVDLPDPPSSSPPAAAGTTTAGAASTAPPGPVLRLDLAG